MLSGEDIALGRCISLRSSSKGDRRETYESYIVKKTKT